MRKQYALINCEFYCLYVLRKAELFSLQRSVLGLELPRLTSVSQLVSLLCPRQIDMKEMRLPPAESIDYVGT